MMIADLKEKFAHILHLLHSGSRIDASVEPVELISICLRLHLAVCGAQYFLQG